jgi:nitroreductase
MHYRTADIIRERRTIRKFRADPVDQALLLELMDIAAWTPNHGLREPWRFIQYKGAGRRILLDAVLGAMSDEEKAKYAEQRKSELMTIPVHLIVIAPVDPLPKRREEDYAAACCWIQTFQLAAWERELGVVWKTNNYMFSPAFLDAIGIGEDEKVVGVLHIGYAEVVPEPRPRTASASKLTVVDGETKS